MSGRSTIAELRRIDVALLILEDGIVERRVRRSPVRDRLGSGEVCEAHVPCQELRPQAEDDEGRGPQDGDEHQRDRQQTRARARTLALGPRGGGVGGRLHRLMMARRRKARSPRWSGLNPPFGPLQCRAYRMPTIAATSQSGATAGASFSSEEDLHMYELLMRPARSTADRRGRAAGARGWPDDDRVRNSARLPRNRHHHCPVLPARRAAQSLLERGEQRLAARRATRVPAAHERVLVRPANGGPHPFRGLVLGIWTNPSFGWLKSRLDRRR